VRGETGAHAEPDAGGQLSIGGLSRVTGIPIETLRTWERRYGYPVPGRKPSGHRVYSIASVPRLRRIAEALDHGLRASHVVPVSDADLDRLLETFPVAPAREPESRPNVVTDAALEDLLAAVAVFDAERLTAILRSKWSALGPIDFVTACVAPLVTAVGEAWAAGSMGVHHEHFLSERVSDLLRSFRAPFEERPVGPLVVFATLPGEMHGMGLQMVSLLLVVLGCRILYLGTEVPVQNLVTLGRDMNAEAIAISVSAASKPAMSERWIKQIRAELPRRTTVLVGGAGAPMARPGVDVLGDLEDVPTWARRFVEQWRARRPRG